MSPPGDPSYLVIRKRMEKINERKKGLTNAASAIK
jgi:hypothetical protein